MMLRKLDYRLFFVPPVILFLFCAAILVNGYMQTGDVFIRSIELRSGTSISANVEKSIDANALQSQLSSKFGSVNVKEYRGLSGSGITVEFGSEINTTEVLSELQSWGIDTSDASVQSISPELGESFWSQAQLGLLMAFILMGLVVFAFFRTFAPSVAVIVAAFSDIFETMAFMRLFNIELSLAGFAALLMLIGYSVDTDILLTTRMLKKKGGDMFEKAKSAFNTGIGMTVATLGALASIALLSVSAVLSQIAIILIIGLIVDIVNTWLQNVAILLWYCKKHKIGES